MSRYPVSIDCMPEPQLICTVKAGHRLAHAEPQCSNAGRVHLIGNDVDAAENDLVERVGREGLAQQQRSPALDGKIDGRKWADAARLEERRAASVNNVDGPVVHSAAVGRGRVVLVMACLLARDWRRDASILRR